MTGFLFGAAAGIAATTLWAGFCWALDRRRRGYSLVRRWR